MATRRSLAAEASFRARLAELGAELLEPQWRGTALPHRVRCAAGHECTPRPDCIQQGQGICRSCVRNDPGAAEASFRARLAELGAELLEPQWRGTALPHRVRCAAGHECTPRPDDVRKGHGICPACRNKTRDIFYVTADPAGNVKFGITSLDPRPRLAVHKRAGYRQIIRLYVNLPSGLAAEMERRAIAALAAAQIKPIRGREYFPPVALPIILNITESMEVTA
jgi:hypothetical protein